MTSKADMALDEVFRVIDSVAPHLSASNERIFLKILIEFLQERLDTAKNVIPIRSSAPLLSLPPCPPRPCDICGGGGAWWVQGIGCSTCTGLEDPPLYALEPDGAERYWRQRAKAAELENLRLRTLAAPSNGLVSGLVAPEDR
jgi:hypothetical protein